MPVNITPIIPPRITELGGPVIGDYNLLTRMAGILTGYVKVKVDVRVSLDLAQKSAYPRGVKLGVMKQVANSREITLEQMRILLGFAAQRAQR